MTPRVLIATLLDGSGPTGVEGHIREFALYLESVGQPAEVVTPFCAPRILVYPVFAIRRLLHAVSGTASVWWYRNWHRFFLQWALAKSLGREPNSVVYAQCPLSALAALRVRGEGRQRIVLVVHFNVSQADEWVEKGLIPADGLLARRIRALEARTLPRLDGMVFVSSFMRRKLTERVPEILKVDSTIIPNFCTEPGSPIRRGDARVFDAISVGTLEPRKNQQFLIRTLAACAARGHDYSLMVVGDGPDRAALEKLTDELGLRSSVEFIGRHPRAIDLMSHAKVYVHGATIENLPVAIIEAMACGLPIVAPNVGGIPDLISDGVEGLFWDTGDVTSAADVLIELLSDPTKLRAFGNAAKLAYQGKFSTKEVASKLLTYLRAGRYSPDNSGIRP